MDFARRDAVKVLTQCILNSSYEEISKEIKSSMNANGKILPDDLRRSLCTLGKVTDFEVMKVINLLSMDGSIF